MKGRRGGRIGLDAYPINEPAHGVWTLNEIYYETRFNSWPVVKRVQKTSFAITSFKIYPNSTLIIVGETLKLAKPFIVVAGDVE